MSSQFGWVDFAEEDRQRMLNVISIFSERSTRDELGIGTVRDAFADHFLPGTSTIQTRARYMLFVPWIYRELEEKAVSSAKIAARARSWEIALIDPLLESDDGGIIGGEAGKHLQRLPSSVYWSGLGSWGIRLFRGSQDQYHRYLDSFYRLKKHREQDDDKEPVGGPLRENWDPGIPEQPDNMWEYCEMALTKEEAQYLQDKILCNHRDSLLAKLIATDPLDEDVAFPWEHPVMSTVSESLRQDLLHARNFSEAIHGAALLYNLMLARQRETKIWIDKYEDRFAEWAAEIRSRWDSLHSWHAALSDFWALISLKLAQIPRRTRTFVTSWLGLVFGDIGPENVLNDTYAQNLIRDREVQLKGPRARLANPTALEMWRGASGDRQLDYRWAAVRDIVRDITVGLREEEPVHV